MWTKKTRASYNRDHLRYPSDLTDEEWAFVEPLIPPAKRDGNKRSLDIRDIVNGILYVLSTGCQWRAIPKDFGEKSTTYDYFQRWVEDRTLDRRMTRSMRCAAIWLGARPARPPPSSIASV